MKMFAFIFAAFLFSQQPSVDVSPVSTPVKPFASYPVTCMNAYGLPFVIRLLDPATGTQVYATAVTSGYFSSFTQVPQGVYNITVTAGVPGTYNYRIGSVTQTGVLNGSASNVSFPGGYSPLINIY
jgi:hypothetical protein